MVTPNSLSFSQDHREPNPALLNAVVPRGTTALEARELQEALTRLWPDREVRVFEAPDLRQARIA